MKLLIFDFEVTGHHSEYIGHLADFLISKNSQSNIYHFCLHPDFPKLFPEIDGKLRTTKCLVINYLDRDELDKLKGLKIWKKSLKLFSLVDRLAKDMKADKVLLLSLNIFQLAIGLKRTDYQISGILFNQFSRIDKAKLKYQYYRKYFQTKLMLSNKSLKDVFILNDQSSVDSLNRTFNTSVFKVLIDPIPNYIPIDGFDIYKEYSIDKSKQILLHIGALDYRKGSMDILNSLSYLASDTKARIHILFVGLAKEQLRIDIIAKQQQIKDLNLFTWEESFVNNEKMRSLFDQCDVVLMPYKNSEASSGILGHAANSDKPVIATGKGLLKDLVLQFNLGLLIDDVSPENIAKAITKALEEDIKLGNFKSFVENRSPKEFAKTILL